MPCSPRRSFDDVAVGLGIVAAMRLDPRSDPIPIVSACGLRRRARGAEAEGGPGRKRAATASGGGGGGRSGGGVVFFQSPERAEELPPAWDFLSRCCLCRKSLHGIDIFMYRGERAFCSMECRFHQMRSDKHREKCSNEMLKSCEYSVSPHSAPMSLCY